MAGISLLWLLLPSVGLAAYIQYTANHYDKKIEDIEDEIKKLPSLSNLIERLPYDMAIRYMETVGHTLAQQVKLFDKKYYNEKDKTQSILRLIVWFIVIVVVCQFISLSFFNIFSLTTYENPLAKWAVFIILSALVVFFLILYIMSIKHIDAKKQEWELATRIHTITQTEYDKDGKR